MGSQRGSVRGPLRGPPKTSERTLVLENGSQNAPLRGLPAPSQRPSQIGECQMAVFGKGGFSTYPSVTCKCVPRCRDAKPPTHLCFPLWFFPKGRFASAPMVPDNVRTHCRCRKTAICKTAIWHHPIRARSQSAIFLSEL